MSLQIPPVSALSRGTVVTGKIFKSTLSFRYDPSIVETALERLRSDASWNARFQADGNFPEEDRIAFEREVIHLVPPPSPPPPPESMDFQEAMIIVIELISAFVRKFADIVNRR